MAKFEGTFEEFEKFIGPTTNKLVTKLGKELKKSQRSCQNHVLGEHTSNSEYCGKYKGLDTAHFSHNKLDRKSMIKNILNEHFANENSYSVDLNLFLSYYEQAHLPLSDNLIMLCRKHHSAYDKKYKVKADDILQNKIDTEIEIASEEITKAGIGKLKKKLVNEIGYLKEGKINIASISGKEKFFWNFNISKNNKKGFLLCLNQFDKSVTVLKYDFTQLKVGRLKEDKKTISLIVPYSEIEFKDRKTAYEYEIVENIILQ
jgi:hypothetical protein